MNPINPKAAVVFKEVNGKLQPHYVEKWPKEPAMYQIGAILDPIEQAVESAVPFAQEDVERVNNAFVTYMGVHFTNYPQMSVPTTNTPYFLDLNVEVVEADCPACHGTGASPFESRACNCKGTGKIKVARLAESKEQPDYSTMTKEQLHQELNKLSLAQVIEVFQEMKRIKELREVEAKEQPSLYGIELSDEFKAMLSTLIECPFCQQKDFDLIGLKDHIINYCVIFAKTESI